MGLKDIISSVRNDPSFGPSFAIVKAARGAADVALALRENAGLTQGQLAKRLDLPVSVISEIESGRVAAAPSASLLARIAAACDDKVAILRVANVQTVLKDARGGGTDSRKARSSSDRPREGGGSAKSRSRRSAIAPSHERRVTRADLAEAVFRKLGLSRTESAAMVEMVLREISDALVAGEAVKLSSFGSFIVRDLRISRTGKSDREISISLQRTVSFKPSNTMSERIATSLEREKDSDQKEAG